MCASNIYLEHDYRMAAHRPEQRTGMVRALLPLAHSLICLGLVESLCQASLFPG
jgi:hypothetical protein